MKMVLSTTLGLYIMFEHMYVCIKFTSMKLLQQIVLNILYFHFI